MSFKYPNIINTGQDTILRGTNQQTDLGLLYTPPTFRQYGQGPTADPVIRKMEGIEIGRFELHNGAAANNVGIGFRFANHVWEAGLSDATSGYAKDANFQAVAAVAEIGTVTGDGILIWSKYPFNWVSCNVTTAMTDSSGGTDSTDVAFTNQATPTALIDHFATDGANPGIKNIHEAVTTSLHVTTNAIGISEAVLVFDPPNWWGKNNLATVDVSGTSPIGWYGMQIEWTSGDTITKGVITGMEIGWMLTNENVASDGGIWEVEASGLYHPAADGVVAFFEIVDDGNRVYAEVRPRS